MENKQKKRNNLFILLFVVLLITIGFAYLSSSLSIFGTSKITESNFSIHWDGDSIEDSGVDAVTPATITDENSQIIEFSVNLVLPGDYYEFTVDAINDGKIAGEIKSVTYEIYNKDGEVITTPSNMIYTLKYNDNTIPKIGDKLNVGDSKKYKVRVGFNSAAEEIPTTDQEYTFKIEIKYEQQTKTTP